MKVVAGMAALVLVLLLAAGCAPAPAPTPTPAPVPTATPTVTQTPVPPTATPVPPTDEVLQAAMNHAVGAEVPAEYRQMAREQAGIGPVEPLAPLHAPDGFHVLIIGSGVTGVLAARTLRQLGLDNVTVVDRNPEPGGTWYVNRYPGCRVDTPSMLYSYSFDQDPDWPEHFSRQPELLRYVKAVADRSGLGERMRHGTEVVAMTWDEADACWQVDLRRIADGPRRIVVLEAEQVSDQFHARFSATGRRYLYRILNRPAAPALERDRVWHLPFPLDLAAMNEGAQRLVGRHDFTTFRSIQCQAKDPEKTLDVLRVTRDGTEVRIEASARSFLHNQVRSMVGTLALVGEGKWSPDDVTAAIAARDRTACGTTAPAQGLYLAEVRDRKSTRLNSSHT